ncbi:Microfibril-associated/Pre-mRNA processing-telated protein [Cryptosporidium tyzzeri]|nr:Microfibril-associated/Pre-mRNA processing-telated protein [Cryptosporidium tyzzeri]
MNRPKYISKLRRKTIIIEKNRSQAINETIKFSLNIKDELSDVSCARIDTECELKNQKDKPSKVDDHDEINRKLDYLRWKEREYKRLKGEHFDYMVNSKCNHT